MLLYNHQEKQKATRQEVKKMKELKKSLKQLGIKGHVMAIKKSDIVYVFANGIYVGLWSLKRNTFVD